MPGQQGHRSKCSYRTGTYTEDKVNDIDKKKLIITRIIAHLNPVPANCVQELLGQSLEDLQVILDKLATIRDLAKVEEAALARSQAMIRRSKGDHAWAYVLCKVSLNGKRLEECDANREILEGMIQPHEEASPALYETILKQYSNQFSWATPQAQPNKEDQRAAFDAFVRDHDLSSCEANFQLFRQSTRIENFAAASQAEEAAYAEQAALQRNKWLRTGASPLELKAEARYETQTQVVASQQAQADASLEAYKQRDQYAGYKTLPAHIDRKTLIAASKDELRKWSRLYGQFQLNTALRAQQ
jgi:hypothetical protein